MAGGILQLASHGIQDIIFTNNPEITFFKIVFRRHTNFSTEIIPQYFSNIKPDFGQRVSCIIGKNGDLIRKIFLVVELPAIPIFQNNNQLDNITKFAWIKKIGFGIIKSIEIEINGLILDKNFGDYLNIWSELLYNPNKNINKLIGNIPYLTEFSNGKKTYKLYIPLEFWFNRITGLVLPIICLNSQIKINLEIQDLNKLFILAPTHYIQIKEDLVNFEKFEYLIQNIDGQLAIGQFIYFDILDKKLYYYKLTDNNFLAPNKNINYFKYIIRGFKSKFEIFPKKNTIQRPYLLPTLNLNLKNIYLLVEYIYIDDLERSRITKNNHEYLIETVSALEYPISGNGTFRIYNSSINKQIIWVTQLNSAYKINQLFNYSDNLIEPCGSNIILSESIKFAGLDRIGIRESDYFTKIQLYQNNYSGSNINLYSFGLYPNNNIYQPSGYANLSNINSEIQINTKPVLNFNNMGKIKIYSVNYNILRISNGLVGLVF